MWSQIGSELYARGARSLRNFVPVRQGAAMSRPGTEFLGAVKNGDAATHTAGKVRLVPFIYSSSDTVQNYVLEFGAGYIRIWNQGALVSSEAGVVEVPTTYTEAELPYLRWAQSGDILTICHPAHAAAELKRVSHTSWTLADIVFARPAPSATPLLCQPLVGASPTSATVPPREWVWCATEILRDDRGILYESAPVTLRAISVSEWSSSQTYASGDYVTSEGHLYRSIQAANTAHPVTDTAWWVLDDTGSALGASVTPRGKVTVAPDCPINILLLKAVDTTPNWVGQRIYRGRGNVFGHIGDANGGVFTDVGDTPDFSVQPPQGRNPFVVFYQETATAVTEHPAAVSFFEERRCFARTDSRPAFVFASSVGDYANFDDRLLPVADEALKFELAARRREEIRSLIDAGDKLLALTNGSVWSISGSGGPLTFDNIEAKRQSSVGASWLEPVALDGVVLYAGATSGVHALEYEFQAQRFVRDDVSLVAQHLHRGHTLVDWAFAEHPWSVLWAVREDGSLLSLTVDIQRSIAGWAHHDTNGSVESVCVIPEGTEDAVYLVVKRQAKDGAGVLQDVRYVERMRSRVLVLGADGTPDVKQNFALDCSYSYSGGPTASVSGLDHLAGRDVYAVADGQVIGPLTVSTAGVVDLGLPADVGATVVHVGLSFTADIETLDYPAALERQKTVTAITFDVFESRGLYIGQDFQHLTEWVQRTVSDSYSPPAFATARVRMPVLGTWDASVRAVLRQTLPLPVTVTAVTLEVDVGG